MPVLPRSIRDRLRSTVELAAREFARNAPVEVRALPAI
jgi:hypothetical protein